MIFFTNLIYIVMLQYSQIKDSLLAIKRALEGDANAMAEGLVDELLGHPEFHGVSICSVIGRQDIKAEVDPTFIVSGAPQEVIDELAERYGSGDCGDSLNELAAHYLDVIQTPADFVAEFPDRNQLIPAQLVNLIETWMQGEELVDGKLKNDFLYWAAGSDFNEVRDWFDSL